jgi:hypothetical protein
LTTATLSPALRALIDERLDGIDRVLRHSRTPRPERLEILDSVENQILEMLAKRTADEPTRRDLLAVLAELDPPEAMRSATKLEVVNPKLKSPLNRNRSNGKRRRRSGPRWRSSPEWACLCGFLARR